MKSQAFRPEALFKKNPAAQAFSSEFCKLFKNTFFIEHLQTTASAKLRSVYATKLTIAFIAYHVIPWKTFNPLHLFRQYSIN